MSTTAATPPRASAAVSPNEAAEAALRLAENMFLRGDLAGARREAARARALCPAPSPLHPAAARAMAAYCVHVVAAAGNARGRGVDWHTLLGVRRGDGLDAAKKQFKLMRLLTHPDKNRSAAADGAFKLVTEAWEAISSGHAPFFSGDDVERDAPKPPPPPRRQSPAPPPPRQHSQRRATRDYGEEHVRHDGCCTENYRSTYRRGRRRPSPAAAAAASKMYFAYCPFCGAKAAQPKNAQWLDMDPLAFCSKFHRF
uniref:J domain-containing protein n=1 Tax=Oryza nivara TaxID=4536 RepID=A0A0E0IP96_ORYNI